MPKYTVTFIEKKTYTVAVEAESAIEANNIVSLPLIASGVERVRQDYPKTFKEGTSAREVTYVDPTK